MVQAKLKLDEYVLTAKLLIFLPLLFTHTRAALETGLVGTKADGTPITLTIEQVRTAALQDELRQKSESELNSHFQGSGAM